MLQYNEKDVQRSGRSASGDEGDGNNMEKLSNFSDLLNSRGLSLTKVAKDTGISRTTLTDLYYNRGNQSVKTLRKLCEYLSCDVGEILNFNK